MIGSLALFGLFMFLGWRAARAFAWLDAGRVAPLGWGYRLYAACSNGWVAWRIRRRPSTPADTRSSARGQLDPEGSR